MFYIKGVISEWGNSEMSKNEGSCDTVEEGKKKVDELIKQMKERISKVYGNKNKGSFKARLISYDDDTIVYERQLTLQRQPKEL